MAVILMPDGTLAGIDAHVARLRELLRDLEELQRSGVPRQQWMDDAVDLQDWALSSRMAPCLRGYPTGHPTIRSGHLMHTSELWVFAPEQGYGRTTSRFYRLGSRLEC